MNHPSTVPEPILEDFFVGDLSAEEKDAVAAQLKTEPSGDRRLAELSKSNDEILEQYPSQLIASQISHRLDQSNESSAQESGQMHRAWVWAAFSTGVAAAAAAMVFVVLRGTPDVEQVPTGVDTPAAYYGIKGDPALIIHKKDGSESQKLHPNDVVQGGDLLQLMYNGGGLRYGVIFSYDGADSITLHFPSSPEESTVMERGGPHSIDHSYQLDDAPSFERFVLVGSNEPMNAAEIINMAQQQLQSGTSVSVEDETNHVYVFSLKKHSQPVPPK